MRFQIGFVKQIKEIQHIHCHRPIWQVFFSLNIAFVKPVISFCHTIKVMFVSDGTWPMAKELNNLEVDIVAID